MSRRHNRDDAPAHPLQPPLPMADRTDEITPGHWLLARLGKRVLRPGGARLTRALLTAADVTNADVAELAPGLGRTAAEILTRGPRSYLGVERDPDAVQTAALVAGHGNVRLADATRTGLPDASADVVIGEAMLTMQADTAKDAVIAEAVRLLRPGGRYGIHELALVPDTVSDATKTAIGQALARAIRVNACPLAVAEWQHLLIGHGLVIDHVQTAAMALLQPRRLIADEGAVGALRFAAHLLARPGARRRVLQMRRTFHRHRQQLAAVAVIAHKPGPADGPIGTAATGADHHHHILETRIR